jgi:hypothetical protein
MEACVTGKAGKGDITMVINLFVVNKVRQAYEMNAPPHVIPAKVWLENGGGDVDSNVFGVTDQHFQLEGDEQLAMKAGTEGVRYRVDYTFWMPEQLSGNTETEPAAERGTETVVYRSPTAYFNRDYVTLINKKGNWRISEIVRESR